MDQKIVLNKNSFMALASESRIDVLKKLDERQMTVSELAKNLEMSKPAVLKHLSKLVDAGLVKKIEGNRKWIYYSLTMHGKNIMHPERVKITVLLSTSLISLIGGIVMLWQYLADTVNVRINKQPILLGDGSGNQTADKLNETLGAGNEHILRFVSHNTDFIKISMILSIVAACLCLAALYIWYTRNENNLFARLPEIPE